MANSLAVMSLRLAVIATIILGLLTAADAALPEDFDGNYLPLLKLPRENWPPELSSIVQSAVPSALEAQMIAFMKDLGMMNAARVVALWRYTPSYEDPSNTFAKRGDWIWQAVVGWAPNGIDIFVFVNARTKEVRVVNAK